MKRMLQAVAVMSVIGAPLAAQETTQQTVVGASGDPVYSVQVTGVNGETYNCRPDIQTVNGQLVRRCQRLNVVNGQLLGGSLATTGAIAAAAIVLVALASDGGSSTTTTN
ncbi:hypothetical protein [uncultured Tateyamaria sp.]|uniref:hypothetical protein n=1 Tax=uncultured Tateyamaria sp. TaxID=455651 RepID=UPI00261456E5|nr:hypothetical protein [uncultured Tateyamaria sp.]